MSGGHRRHLDREALERLLASELPDETSRALQRHLFTCPTCESRLIALLPGPAVSPPLTPSGGYQDLVRRIVTEHRTEITQRRRSLMRERVEAAALWSEIEPQDQERRRSLVAEDIRFQSWGFFELLVDRARDAVLQDVGKAEDLLRLALEVTERLAPGEYGAGSIDAAKARVWTHLGNTVRVLGDFRQAEAAFQTAELHFSRSWLDPLDEALLLELKAALRRGQGRFDEALELLEGAIAIYREVNEPHLEGQAFVVKGLTLQYQGDVEEAADCFRTSLSLLDALEEPRLAALCHLNLVGCLQDAGRSAEAAALIPETRSRVEQAGKRVDLLRLRWTEGKVAASTGQSAEAEAAFREVRETCFEDRRAFDAALISLDLAALYLRQRRMDETKRLAAEILPVFQSREVHREALGALIVFQQAAEMEQLTLGLIDEVAAYLERARNEPQLRFREKA